ncbi:MAG: PilZ domain-containing protein [Candidatus Sulfotelmatobacter sp.]|jgi:hypothetical protein
MFAPSATDPHPKQRRSPRFPFDSLVRVTALRLVENTRLWGRSTDLCREGIGVTVAGELTPEELVAMQIPLPSTKPMNVRASVRYRNQLHCGFEFVDLLDQQREAIQAACEKLRTRLKSGQR